MRNPAFLTQTRRMDQNLGDMTFTTQGQTLTTTLPAVGLANILYLHVFGTITTTASGAWDANYFPYNLFSNINLRTSEGITLYNGSGYTNYLMQLGMHANRFDPLHNPTNAYLGTQGAKVVTTAPSGNCAAQANPIGITYLIPIAADDSADIGLQMIQNDSLQVVLSMTLNQFSALTTGTDPAFSAASFTVRPTYEWFSIPKANPQQNGAIPMPDQNWIFQTIEDVVPWVGTGEFQYKPTPGGIFTKTWMHFQNNGVPAAFFATANDPQTQNFNNISIVYGGSQYIEAIDMANFLYRTRRMYGQDWPDGTFFHDWASGGGSPELGLDRRDTFNTAGITEFTLRANWGTTAPTNGQLIALRQQLLARPGGVNR